MWDRWGLGFGLGSAPPHLRSNWREACNSAWSLSSVVNQIDHPFGVDQPFSRYRLGRLYVTTVSPAAEWLMASTPPSEWTTLWLDEEATRRSVLIGAGDPAAVVIPYVAQEI